MSRYQAKWDPNRERRITESKIYKESHLFANNKHQRLYLIQKEWFNEWMGFLYGNRDRCPSQIDNTELANVIINEGLIALSKNVDYYEFTS